MPCIALFDSGVGGLSVLTAINQHIPDANIIYFADHQASPYGDKDPQWLNSRIIKLVSLLDRKHHPDVIVIACNTASTMCLDALRARTKTPIVGVVPAIKTAAHLSMTQSIGVLATPTTINSTYLDQLIQDFAVGCTVTKVASTELVTMAEKKLNHQPINLHELNNVIAPFIQNKCDLVVLGCTHFPHLINELIGLAPDIHWIDSGTAIARRCASVLSNIATSTHSNSIQHTPCFFYSTGHIDAGLKRTVKSMGFEQIHNISVTDN